MPDILVDSNILLDIATSDPRWLEWSSETLRQLGNAGSALVINPLIFAEVSIGYTTVEDLEAALRLDIYRHDDLPYAAAFLAGKAFQAYKRRGGLARSPMPDFYIGAHAAVARFQLLTRDAARYRTYFPTVQLITP